MSQDSPQASTVRPDYRPMPKPRRRRHANLASDATTGATKGQDSTATDNPVGSKPRMRASFYSVARQVERRSNLALHVGGALQVKLFSSRLRPCSFLEDAPAPIDSIQGVSSIRPNEELYLELLEACLKVEFEDAYFDVVDELILTTVLDCLLDAPSADCSACGEISVSISADISSPFHENVSPLSHMLNTLGPVVDGCVPSKFATKAILGIPLDKRANDDTRTKETISPESANSDNEIEKRDVESSPDKPLLLAKAPRRRQRQREALIDDLTEDNFDLILSGPQEYKDVVLPVTPGVSLGMIFDIAESQVVVAEFVPVPLNSDDSSGDESTHVVGCAEASGEIGIGDMVIGIDGQLLEMMDFHQIIAVVQDITRSGRNYVVLTIRLHEFIAKGAEQNELNLSLEKFIDDDASPLALDGSHYFNGGMSALVPGSSLLYSDHYHAGHSSKLRAANRGAYSFPGEIGLRLDPNELNRRLQLLMEDTCRFRSLIAEGSRFGWFEDDGVSPLLRLNSTSTKQGRWSGRYMEDTSDESDNEYSYRERETADGEYLVNRPRLQSSKDGSHRRISGSIPASWNRWIEPLSGTVTDYMQKVSTFEVHDLEDRLQGWGAKYGLQQKKDDDEQDTGGAPDNESPPPVSAVSPSSSMEETKKCIRRPLKNETRIVAANLPDLSAAVEELREQLAFELLSERIEHVTSAQKSLDVAVELAKSVRENQSDSNSLDFSVRILSSVLDETARGVDEGYLGAKRYSSLDLWPPTVLTSVLSTTMGLCWRKHVGNYSVEVITAMLSSWISCIAGANLWKVVDRAFDADITGNEVQSISMDSLRDDSPQSILHFERSKSLITLYALSKIAGWHSLEVISTPVHAGEDECVRQETTLTTQMKHTALTQNEHAREGKSGQSELWSEKEALGFVRIYFAFLPVNDLITAAGFRQWSALTGLILDLSSSEGLGLSHLTTFRHACGLLAHLIRHNGRHMRPDSSLKQYFGSSGAPKWLGETTLLEACEPLNSDSECDKGKSMMRQILSKAQQNDAYLALLLEVGQLLWAYDATFAASVFAQAFPKLLPWHVWRILASSGAPLTNSQSDVGLRIAVWWAGENIFFSGSIVAFSCVSSELGSCETHTIKYDDGDVREYDLSTKLFKILVDSVDETADLNPFRFVQCAVEPPTPVSASDKEEDEQLLPCHRFIPMQFDSITRRWWESRMLYHKYLVHLLGFEPYQIEDDDILKGSQYHPKDLRCPRNYFKTVLEFIELSLLFSTDEAFEQSWLKQRTIPGSNQSEDNIFLLRAALAGDDITRGIRDHNFPGVNETLESAQFAAGIGMVAMQERLRNSVIRAKESSFTPLTSMDTASGEEFNSQAIDQDAWLMRVIMHPDYNYSDKIWRLNNDGRAWIANLWNEYGSDDVPTSRYTDSVHDDIDIDKLELKLAEFYAMTDELDDSLHGDDQQGAGASEHWVSHGYRNAWNAPRMDTSVGNLLQEAWSSIVPEKSKGRLYKKPIATQLTLMEGVDSAIKFSLQNESTCSDESLLRIGVICMQYGYWQGVLQVCDTWVYKAIERGFGSSELLELSAVKAFELIRHTALTVWSSSEFLHSSSIEFIEYVLISSLSLMDRLAASFESDPGLARRMAHVCETTKSAGDRLVESLLLELIAVNHPVCSARSSQLLVSCLVSSLGVLRGLAVASWIQGINLEGGSDLDSAITSIDRAFLNDPNLQKNGRHALAQLYASASFDVPSSSEAGWGFVADSSLECPSCGGCFIEGKDGNATGVSTRCLTLRCGHAFHFECLQRSDFLCGICADTAKDLPLFD